MSYRYLIYGETISDFVEPKTFPRDTANKDYLEFLKKIKDEGDSLIEGMYKDEVVIDVEPVLQPVPEWVQQDIDETDLSSIF
jgi:hypothetical protein